MKYFHTQIFVTFRTSVFGIEIIAEKLFLVENVEAKAIFTFPVCGVQFSIKGIVSNRTACILTKWDSLSKAIFFG